MNTYFYPVFLYTLLSVSFFSLALKQNETVKPSYNSKNTVTSALSAYIVTTSTSCGEANGTASLVIQNATGVPNQIWSNGQTSTTINNLAAGTYSATITDNLCEIVVSGIVGFEEVPIIEWSKNFGGSENDRTWSMIKTSDNQYVITGDSKSLDNDLPTNLGSNDVAVIKTSDTGTLVSYNIYGGSNIDIARNIFERPNNNLVFGGYSASDNGSVGFNYGEFDFWWAELLEDGTIEDKAVYGNSMSEQALDIQPTQDGGFIIVGYTSSVSFGLNSFWIVKVDTEGEFEWVKEYGGEGSDQARTVVELSDGGFLVAGNSTSVTGDVGGNFGEEDIWIIKIDESGNLVWEKNFGGSNGDFVVDIKETLDGNFVLAGFSESNDFNLADNTTFGNRDIWIIKIDESGNLIWDTTFGGSDIDQPYAILPTNDLGFIVVGETDSNDGNITQQFGEGDAWIIKITENGSLQWQKSFGGSMPDVTTAITQNTDGSFVVAGMSRSSDEDLSDNYGKLDHWLFKLIPHYLEIDFGADTVICENDNFILSAYDSLCTDCLYEWSDGNTDSIRIIDIENTTTFQVTITNSAGCSASDEIVLSVPSFDINDLESGNLTPCQETETYCVTSLANAVNYHWQTPLGDFSTTGNCLEINWFNNSGGEICVTANGDCGENNQPAFCFEVIIQESPNIPEINGPQEVCQNSNVTFSINNFENGLQYDWTSTIGTLQNNSGNTISIDFDNPANGEVCVTATNNCNTNTSNCFPITVGNSVVLNFSETVCFGETALFNDQSYSSGDHEIIVASTTSTECDTTIFLEVVELPEPILETQEVVICPGDFSVLSEDTTIMFTDFLCDSIIQTIEYIIIEENILVANDDNFQFPLGELTAEFSLFDNDEIDNENDFSIELISNTGIAGEAEINSDDKLIYNLLEEAFTGFDTLQYTICYDNCPHICDTAFIQIFIENNCYNLADKEVPTGFSPNNDGINDYFHPLAEFIEFDCPLTPATVELCIYNRWGDVVFQSFYDTILSQGWDGKSQKSGQILPQGTYYWAMKIPVLDEIRPFHGPLNLLR